MHNIVFFPHVDIQLSMCWSKEIFKNRLWVSFEGKVFVCSSVLGHPQSHVLLGQNVISLLTLCRYARWDTFSAQIGMLTWDNVASCQEGMLWWSILLTLLRMDLHASLGLTYTYTLYPCITSLWLVLLPNWTSISPACSLFCSQIEQIFVCLAQKSKPQLSGKKLTGFSFCWIIRICVSVRLPAHS